MAKARKITHEMNEQILLSPTMKRIVASLHLEDIELSPETIADLQLVESGKLSQKEAIARVLARVQK